ncbi:MAG: serine/threonine protein kinase [Acidobacteria bacterium]|nr:serine/threonine protein kinase [Acidobacteriota bacterium]
MRTPGPAAGMLPTPSAPAARTPPFDWEASNGRPPPAQLADRQPLSRHCAGLPPAEREVWLAALGRSNPVLAEDIDRWLAECAALEGNGFLEDGAAVSPARASPAGLQLGAYRLVEPIGHGGMGTVWAVERTDGRFERRVAVKLLSAALVGHQGEARFAREGRILGRLVHPQIARLLDAGVSSIGQPYLVLELVDGEAIDRYCDRLRLGVEDRVRLFLAVLGPVAHAHANLVVHRDLKPSNVFVTSAGDVRLLDFGIARLLDAEHSAEGAALTHDGDSVLTPAYAAPEQVTGAEVTTATDVYALGVLLYVLLPGRHPAQDALASPASLVRSIVEEEPPRMSTVVTTGPSASDLAWRRGIVPSRLRAALRGDLDVIVSNALQKQPGDRYVSVALLAEDLRRYLQHEPIAARAGSVVYRAATFARRYRVAVTASNPEPAIDLRDAYDLSRLDGAFAETLSKAGREERAREVRRQRMALWQGWSVRRPADAFIARQLAASRVAGP